MSESFGAVPRSSRNASVRSHHVLSDGRSAVVVTSIGGGFSSFGDWLLDVWRPDPVEGDGGFYLFARDLESGEFWTVSGRACPGQEHGSVTGTDRAITIERRHASVHSRVSVALEGSPALEVRTCALTNTSNVTRRIELTSFLALALNTPAAHEGHPAFSKLFVQTRRVDDGFLLATRRPRGHGETSPAVGHGLLDAPVTDYSTDRARFIGRGRHIGAPAALVTAQPLGATCGNVLDPAFALRTVLTLEPGSTSTVRFGLAAADAAADVIERLRRASTQRGTAGSPVYSSASAPIIVAQLTSALGALMAPTTEAAIRARAEPATVVGQHEPLLFDNGFGGFAASGREYVVRMPRDTAGRPQLPPAAWINVLANPYFGCFVSETGAGNSWWRNSREFRLTPWSNDPVVDPHGDALYVKDLSSGAVWSPLPGPVPAPVDYEARHGFGFSAWRCNTAGLEQETTMFVPRQDPLRVTRVRIRNTGQALRRVAVYGYNRWVLGGTAEATRATVNAEFSPREQAVLARNSAALAQFAGTAFAAVDRDKVDGWCADRAAFLGVPGSVRAPAALTRDTLPPVSSSGEPCAVLQVTLDIPPGETREVSFLLGMAATDAEVAALLARYRSPGEIEAELLAVRASWQALFERVQVKTPSPGLDALLNGWLPYQDIACRIWARSAFYQSGGAFGFRDQLQDAASIVLLRPDMTRAQILLHAAHQFVEGDVLHWWHPPHEVGIRTRFADDLLWLPWITAYYTATTGDAALLDERVPFVHARALLAGEAEAYLPVQPAAENATIYEHCCRAIDRSLTRGVHGLPLFGAGDWNDGMNRVGHDGRGESTWMGFFLVTVIDDFLPLCVARGDAERAKRYRRHRDELIVALNADGWDGGWYRRGWYDNGAVLGSQSSDECRIDALAQAWAVMSHVAPRERVERALDSVEAHLVDDEQGLIRLLTPPFVDTPNDPGYIKGYVAGVRENGGQYTHAAVWVVRAMAEAGRRDRACQLLEALLPVSHASDRAAAERYKVEPYVIAADVYGAAPHVGRGGWTWYTGSAGWLYRVAIESILGVRLERGTTLVVRPRIADVWPGFQLTYRAADGTTIHLDVRNPAECAARVVDASFDGDPVAVVDGEVRIALPRTGRTHECRIVLGA